MPRTKIVCTIGPASGSEDTIRKLVENGMNVARLNFSHGTHAEHQQKIRSIRRISEDRGRPIAILQDLQGPKIRVGKIPGKGLRLNPGQRLILTGRPVKGSGNRVPVTYAELPSEVSPNDRILLADGIMELVVERIVDKEIHCTVVIGGLLTSHKGINLPTGSIRAASITKKDREDLQFGLENGVDYVALSFVRTGEDVASLKKMIAEAGKNTPVIAKIEKHEALDNIDDIMAAADGIMVARGDLGVETPLQEVPTIQKNLIHKANSAGLPVITATQMLRSMVDSPRPTRAEATDIANAVLDGTDAIMLSEETASGNYPVESVQYMALIAEHAEKSFPHNKYLKMIPQKDISDSVAYAACVVAEQLNAAAIVATTRSGFTAMQISRFKPSQDIIALSPDPETVRRLTLCWGCSSSVVSETKNMDERIEIAARAALETGHARKGDLVVITSGYPVWVAGTTNMLQVKTL